MVETVLGEEEAEENGRREAGALSRLKTSFSLALPRQSMLVRSR